MLENHRLVEACNILDGEFAFVAYDKRHKRVIAARDAMGIRPLFYGYTAENQIAFASEMKDLIAFVQKFIHSLPGIITMVKELNLSVNYTVYPW